MRAMATECPAVSRDVRMELIDILATSRVANAVSPAGVPSVLAPVLPAACVLFDVYGTLFVSASGDIGTTLGTSRTEHFSSAIEHAGVAGLQQAAPGAAEQFYFEGIESRHAASRERGIPFPEVNILDVWQEVLVRLAMEGLSVAPSAGDLAVLAMKTAVWFEVAANPVAPMPGAAELIAALGESGYLLGIVSNAQFYTPLLFPALLGREMNEMGFGHELCSWSYLLGEAKPSTLPFRRVLERLDAGYGISPQRVVFVGNDMLNDIHAAQSAGCRAVLFAGDERSLRLRRGEPLCANVVPDGVTRSLGELVELLHFAAQGRAE